MKRTISIVALALVVVMMMGCLVACGGGKLQAGTYKLKEVSGDGAEMYDGMKDSITLEVQDGGKASMSIAGISSLELTFNEDTGKVNLQGSEVPYKVDGNKITIEDSSGKMVFEK
ncbi:MAG: hypothetical protein IJ639_03985 [Ruminococcus sp.]|nr:hypothetical protein [Ruminococcus sp.]